MSTALATLQIDGEPTVRHGVIDCPPPIQFKKPLTDYRQLHETVDLADVAEQLRMALVLALMVPRIDSAANDPIDKAGHEAFYALFAWHDHECKRTEIFGPQGEPSEAWMDATGLAIECLRRHELLLMIRRIGRLRAPWILRPSRAGYLLELVTVDNPDPRLDGLLIDAALPREQVRALIQAYEAGIKRGQTIARDEIDLAFNRAKGRRS